MEIIGRHDAHARGLRLFYTGKPCKHGHLAQRYVVNGSCTACLSLKSPATPRDGLKWNQIMAPGPLAFPATAGEDRVTPEMVKWVWAYRVLPGLAGWMEEYWAARAAGDPTAQPRHHSTREDARAAAAARAQPPVAMSPGFALLQARREAEARVTPTDKLPAGATLSVMLSAGWTCEALVQHGYATWNAP